MSQSYQIPMEKKIDNKTTHLTQRSDSVSVTMVSATPPNSSTKPIQQLPTSTLSHLENIFEAVKKQVSIWGERARWKIDLVLLPAEDDEDIENSSQVVGGLLNQQSGLHTPTSDNAGDTSTPAHITNGQLQLTSQQSTTQLPMQSQLPQVQFYAQAENVRVESSMRYILDDDTIEKLDIETAKHMLKDAILHIRAYESTLNRVSYEAESKIKEAQARAKKANEHIESMAKFHSIREKEKASKHSVELKILQEDVKILSRKYKETNVQLADVKEKYASMQEQEARREAQPSLLQYSTTSNTTEVVGKIVEYVPQQQTNGYLTYNFPHVQKMPSHHSQQYIQNQHQQLNPPPANSSSPSVQYSNGLPIIPSVYASQQQDPNRRNFPPYQIPQALQNNPSQYPPYLSNNRSVFPSYSFPRQHQDIRQNQSITYPTQLNNPSIPSQPRVVPTYAPIQPNIPATHTTSTTVPAYTTTQRLERSGLDNLSLAAELILSSAISSLPTSTLTPKQQDNQQKTPSREVSSSSDCSTVSMETPINITTASTADTLIAENPININNNDISAPSTPPPRFNARITDSSKNIDTPDTITAIADDDTYQSTPIDADGHSVQTLSPSTRVDEEDNHSDHLSSVDEFMDGMDEGNLQIIKECKSDIKIDVVTEDNIVTTSNREESEEESNGPPKKKRRLSNVKRGPPVQIF
ncbi:17584_t:CDS:10 [Funneliformis geosporum]|uniref:3421_t:CDS:1 n=1 Tax=Funneliformis geosporum TaxID=1117311 RepID=A0A9W4WYY8_9GLOM|nr:3421_t:CDS:10 [Funneliformis geosporum]CAI2189990.1 17584_t:CDS:10 [Funneliformis geosporum]